MRIGPHEAEGRAVASPPPPSSSPPQAAAARPSTATSKIKKPSKPSLLKPSSSIAGLHLCGRTEPPPIRAPAGKYRGSRTRLQVQPQRGQPPRRPIDSAAAHERPSDSRKKGAHGGNMVSPVLCAEGGTRTHTRFPSPDFESGASASSATSALPLG